MRKGLATSMKKVHLLKRKNEESRIFLEKNAAQTENEFDSFFIRAKTEVQIKESQLRKDLTYKFESEEILVRKSVCNILAMENTLKDLRCLIHQVQLNLVTSYFNSGESCEKEVRANFETINFKHQNFLQDKEKSLELVAANYFKASLKNMIFGHQIGYISVCSLKSQNRTHFYSH